MWIYRSSLILAVLSISVLLSTEVFGQPTVEKAKLLYHKAKFNDVIIELNSVLVLTPGVAEAYLYRGNAYFSMVNFKMAIQNYTKAIEIKPDYALAYYNRAVVLFSEQRYNDCWQDVHKAQELGYQPSGYFFGQLKEDSGINE